MNQIANSSKSTPRAYKVSRERLIAFKALTVEQRLKMGRRICGVFEIG